MLTRPLGALLIAASTSYALTKSSPFFLLSTEPIHSDALHSAQITTTSSLEDSLPAVLRSCDASAYIFVQQGGVHVTDLQDASALPQLQKRMGQSQYKTVIQIPELMGNFNSEKVVSMMGDAQARVSTIRYPIIIDSETSQGRKAMLEDTDNSLAKLLPEYLSNQTSHVIIFSSKSAVDALAETEYVTPQHVEMDEPPFDETMHTDLKRDVEYGSRRRRQASNDDDDNFQKGLGLFERYQFLSPGIFMGLTVSLLLFVILYVGITAIASLEVSYMAFSKEMGPQAQKKQQ